MDTLFDFPEDLGGGSTGPNTGYDNDTEVEVLLNYLLSANCSDIPTGMYGHSGECVIGTATGVTADSAAYSFGTYSATDISCDNAGMASADTTVYVQGGECATAASFVIGATGISCGTAGKESADRSGITIKGATGSLDDYYKLLCLESGASKHEVAKAYKKLAFLHHPDRNPDDREGARQRFKAISIVSAALNDLNHCKFVSHSVSPRFFAVPLRFFTCQYVVVRCCTFHNFLFFNYVSSRVLCAFTFLHFTVL